MVYLSLIFYYILILINFYKKLKGYTPFFTIGVDVSTPPPPKYPIREVYVRISPDSNVIEKQIHSEISSMPFTVQISHSNIREYISHRKLSIEWKFKEIDVTELFRLFDEKFQDRTTFYTHKTIMENLSLFSTLLSHHRRIIWNFDLVSKNESRIYS